MTTDAASQRYSSPTRECDLIMKGGITSGVVYPGAACRLAETHRFRQVGGTSAGAIAAAAVAAAERGRHLPAPAGFAGLERVSSELGSGLATLFQPAPSTRAAFGILTTWIEPGWGAARRLLVTVGRLLTAAPVVAVLTFLLAMAPGVAVAAATQQGPEFPHWWTPRASWWVWVPGAFVLAVLAAAARLAARTVSALTDNGFGLCNGHVGVDPAHEPLTDWTSRTLDTLAGLAPGQGPLLFGHLWGEDPENRVIDLQVMTTCLTLRRPYRFPFTSNIFFACRSCMSTYFPEPVVAALFPDDGPAAGEDEDWTCPLHPTQKVRHLPPAAHLPVVVAARISLSFPGLISAVPFVYLDHSRPEGVEKRVVAWFSDGGISSNFPMHFFDRLWPSRPTFGINLEDTDPDYPDLVWRPTSPRQGLLPRAHAITSLGGFLHAIADTMQNWADTTQLSLPGFRDRVVEVRTSKSEGGMNLRMPPEVIEALSERGREAARRLEAFDFDLHRWVRYRVAMPLLDGTLAGLVRRFDGADGREGYQDFLERYGPVAPSYPLGTDQRVADSAATAALMEVARDWERAGHPGAAGATPHPEPELRLSPPQ